MTTFQRVAALNGPAKAAMYLKKDVRLSILFELYGFNESNR